MIQKQLVDYESGGVTCPVCGNEYSSRMGLSKHHSAQHGDTYDRLAVCNCCGKIYSESPKNLHATNTHYCTKECRGEGWSNTRSGKSNPLYKERLDKKCDYCGADFEVKPSKSDKRFCSRSCYHTWNKENDVLKGENNPQYKEPLTLQCEWCKEQYEVPPVHEDSRFCCADCQHEWLSTRTGPDHPLHKGGRDYYVAIRRALGPSGWESLRKKYNKDECEMCGAETSPRGRDLSLHHIVPVLSGGTNHGDNFMTLCEPCHSKAEMYCSDLPGFDRILVE